MSTKVRQCVKYDEIFGDRWRGFAIASNFKEHFGRGYVFIPEVFGWFYSQVADGWQWEDSGGPWPDISGILDVVGRIMKKGATGWLKKLFEKASVRQQEIDGYDYSRERDRIRAFKRVDQRLMTALYGERSAW